MFIELENWPTNSTDIIIIIIINEFHRDTSLPELRAADDLDTVWGTLQQT